MKKSTPKKTGRPAGNPASKKVKPNVTLDPGLISESQVAAELAGIGYSEWVSRAIAMQIARQEASAEAQQSHGIPSKDALRVAKKAIKAENKISQSK